MIKPEHVETRIGLIKKICKNKKVLDLGCCATTDVNLGEEQQTDEWMNDEEWLHGEIRKVTKKLYGIDNNPHGIKKMVEEGYNVKIADVEKFDLKTEFDVLVAGELIEHLSNTTNFLKSCKKHLKKNGKLIITTPNATALKMFLNNGMIHDGHVALYDYNTLSALLKREGMKINEVYYAGETKSTIKRKILRKLFKLRPRMAEQIIVIASKK